MARVVLLVALAIVYSSSLLSAQDIPVRDSTLLELPPFIPPAPVLPKSGYGMKIIQDNTMKYEVGIKPHVHGAPFIEDVGQWLHDYHTANKLHEVNRNPLAADPAVMEYALKNKSDANAELYRSYVITNQKAAGNTQLGRMNVGMREIRYVGYSRSRGF